jgi:hypothetical protein
MTYNNTVIHVLVTYNNTAIHVLMIYNNTVIHVLMTYDCIVGEHKRVKGRSRFIIECIEALKGEEHIYY